MKSRVRSLVALGAGLVVLAKSGLAAGPANADTAGDAACKVVIDESGTQRWTGTPDQSVVLAADDAGQALTDRPDLLLDVALCHDSKEIMVKGLDVSELDAIVSQ
ncbi:hypothetical protein [Aestuariimicrobium ganziense]|uniref:hypothetical protein n=1 Tax=Aestuariimicrobium ganziense TaxID=2773677 RepID=UPI0019417950|nr:hypothetical protein [Aestuariimicrobium ganziense]